MANVKINDLAVIADPASTDVLPIVDVTLDTTNKISIADILKTVPAGTASAPSIAFEGDSNTGIYHPGSEQIGFTTSGSDAIRITSDGKVGIGTTSPISLLHLAANAPYITFEDIDNAQDWQLQATAWFALRNQTSNSELLRVQANGLVGIGTSVPSVKLEVARLGAAWTGAAPAAGTALFIHNGNNGDTSPASLQFGAGNNSNSAVYFGDSGDSNIGSILYNHSDDTLAFRVNNNERLRITSDGLVGIGTTDPATKLEVAGVTTITSSSTSALFIRDNNLDTNGLKLYSDATGLSQIDGGYGELALLTAANERVRIDSEGRLLVGTSSARTGTTRRVNIESNTDAGITVVTNSTNAGAAPILFLCRSRGTNIGDNTIVQQDDALGYLAFNGGDGTDVASYGAWIKGEVDGTPGANDMPGRLVFATTADGASTPTERMRITRNGAVNIGDVDGLGVLIVGTDNNNPVFNSVEGVCLRNQGHIISNTQASNAVSAFRRDGDGSLITFHNNSTTVIGSIAVTGSATAYNTSSDYRLKENIVDLTGAVDRVNQLQVHRFNFIADPDTTVDGFLAHEAQAVVPECVTGTKDEVDDEGNLVYQGIDQSKIVPLLTAALQEALAKIETLEQRLTDAGI